MTEIIAAGVALAALIVIIACTFAGRKHLPPGPDVGLHLFAEDCGDDTQEWPVHDCDGCAECGAPMVFDEDPARPYIRTNLGFGRRNPHCSNCGDLRGGAFGHESSECRYRYGMTASEVAAILPEHQRNAFWDEQIDRYFAEQERAS